MFSGDKVVQIWYELQKYILPTNDFSIFSLAACPSGCSIEQPAAASRGTEEVLCQAADYVRSKKTHEMPVPWAAARCSLLTRLRPRTDIGVAQHAYITLPVTSCFDVDWGY